MWDDTNFSSNAYVLYLRTYNSGHNKLIHIQGNLFKTTTTKKINSKHLISFNDPCWAYVGGDVNFLTPQKGKEDLANPTNIPWSQSLSFQASAEEVLLTSTAFSKDTIDQMCVLFLNQACALKLLFISTPRGSVNRFLPVLPISAESTGAHLSNIFFS